MPPGECMDKGKGYDDMISCAICSLSLYFCRYLLNTCKYQIVYDRLSNESIVAHSNSDWVQDPELHKSVTDYFTLMA